MCTDDVIDDRQIGPTHTDSDTKCSSARDADNNTQQPRSRTNRFLIVSSQGNAWHFARARAAAFDVRQISHIGATHTDNNKSYLLKGVITIKIDVPAFCVCLRLAVVICNNVKCSANGTFPRPKTRLSHLFPHKCDFKCTAYFRAYVYLEGIWISVV